RQQSVAEIVTESIVEWTLVVVARVVLQDMPDVRRVRHEESLIGTGLQVHDVAVSIGRLKKRADRIRAEARKHTQERISPGAWRQDACSTHRTPCPRGEGASV